MKKAAPLAFHSTAPDEWLTGVSSAARLYRRLLVAVASGNDAVNKAWKDGVATEQLGGALTELRRQAVGITEYLVVASRLPLVKRQSAFRPLRSQVDEVERLGARIGTSAASACGHKEINERLKDVSTRLDSLDEARLEAEGELPTELRSRLRRTLDGLRREE